MVITRLVPKGQSLPTRDPEAAPLACGMCTGRGFSQLARFTAPPQGETRFGFADYARTLWRCDCCGHVVNRHGLDLEALYVGQYRDATYGDRLKSIYDRIMALPEGRSDNRGRVRRIEAWCQSQSLPCPGRLLDVGAGLGVFPAAMAERGWQVVALDPDPVACDHLRDVVEVETWCGSFDPRDNFTAPKAQRFDLITFNKVLEHIVPMVETLARAHRFLAPGGQVYVELPDGEGALADAGPDREEFFVEHHCAFSLPSFSLLARRAGYRIEMLERVREPSGKFTLRGFLSPDITPDLLNDA
ncbi:MAG: class I SAM-dependent methyltransferase [Bradymonadia bacterium]